MPWLQAGLNAIRLGHHGVPVILVSGDDALAEEVGELLPWAERVVVKRGLGYSLADSRSPADACEAIRTGMRAAIERIDGMRTYRPPSLDVEIDFRFPAHAAFAAVLPEAERTGPRSVGFSASDGEELYRRFLAAHRLAAAAGL